MEMKFEISFSFFFLDVCVCVETGEGAFSQAPSLLLQSMRHGRIVGKLTRGGRELFHVLLKLQ